MRSTFTFIFLLVTVSAAIIFGNEFMLAPSPYKIIWSQGMPFDEPHGTAHSEIIADKIYVTSSTDKDGDYDFRKLSIYDIQNKRWTTGSKMPSGKSGNSVTVTLDGILYSIGGEGPWAGAWSKEVEAYDPKTDSWTFKADWQTPRRDITAAGLNGKIYVIGGQPNYYDLSNEVDIYDVAADSWTKGPNYPINVSGARAVSFLGNLYVFGGYTGPDQKNRASTDRVFKFDPALNEWIELSFMPFPRSQMSLALYDDKIFILGGDVYKNGTTLYMSDDVWEYSPPNDTYRKVLSEGFVQDIPWAYGTHAPVFEGSIFFASSFLYEPFSNVWTFNPLLQIGDIQKQNDQDISHLTVVWTDVTPFPTLHGSANAESIGDKIYLTSNTDSSGNYNFRDLSIYDSANDRWTQGTKMPSRKSGNSTTAVVNGTLFSIGGEGPYPGWWSPEVQQYSPDSDSWDLRAEWPTPRRDCGAAGLNGKLYVVGGQPNYSDLSHDLDIYDPITDTWSKGPNYPINVAGAPVIEFDNKLYVFGGHTGPDQRHKTSTSRAFVYDPVVQQWNELASMPMPRSQMLVTVYQNKIYIVGGDNWQNGSYVLLSDDILEYSPDEDKYRTVLSKGFTESIPWGYGRHAPTVGTMMFFLSTHAQQHPATGRWGYYPLVQKGTFVDRQTTSVADNTPAVVKGFQLRQNYPNPFNPSTTIEFDVYTASTAKLMIYDRRGRLIRTLFDRATAPGTHTVIWDGRDDTGMALPSGTYFYP